MKSNSTQDELRNKIDQNLYVEDLMDNGFDTFCDAAIAVINSEVLSVLDRLKPLTHEGRGTISWEMDNMLETIEAIRKEYS